MIKINWKKDYRDEFICPFCNQLGMKYQRKVNQSKSGLQKIKFICPFCSKTCENFCSINITQVLDPTNQGVIWYRNHQYKEFICPNCSSHNIYFQEIDKQSNTKRFRCKDCQKKHPEKNSLRRSNISRRSNKAPLIIPFLFEKDQWDLRAINLNYNEIYSRWSMIDFSSIKLLWFKQTIKKYIQHLCKLEKSFLHIKHQLSVLTSFSHYLSQINITGFEQINRSLILDYFTQEKKVDKHKIGVLRSFFTAGKIRGWFIIEQDIIRDNDYPKQRRGNPDPLSDVVREQIEQNLHKLPAPIARMWIICFFTAMRSSELVLLKKDCLIQEGQYWKVVWQRTKTNDCHEIPISRTIAKVIQQQQEYINDLWNGEWEYLFCHYHGLSEVDHSQPKLKPVKKVISQVRHPLLIAIRCLIKSENILDENGNLATFTLKRLRTTRLTQLFEQGHDLAVVSAWAGHKNLATTSTYYTKVSCDLIERETSHIQQALVNSNGHPVAYESFPKSFWEKPVAHKLELAGTHINTPIYGYCGLDLNLDCDKFRACYTCQSFVAVSEKLPQYIKVRDELRGKEAKALTSGQDVLVEQFGRQADQLDKIIASLQEVR